MASGAECEQAIVYIVDDDASLRTALESLFRSVSLKVIAFGSAREFLDAPRADRPSCLVLDVRLPGLSGLDFQDQLASLGITLPIVFMTGHGDIPMTVRGIKAGAVDFLAKPFRDQDMLDAVMAAIKRDEQTREASAAQSALRERYDALSAREQQVLALVVTGRLNKQIAGDLDLSEITIKVHRSAAMHKMGARTVPDLVRMAEALNIRLPQAH